MSGSDNGWTISTSSTSNLSHVSIPGVKTGDGELLPLYALVPVVVVMNAVVVVGVVGNLLVLVSYRLDPRLRTVSNLYLFHLAIVDLLLAAVSMPFYLVYTCLHWYWPFGRLFCTVYQVSDYTMCLNSVVLVILISFDHLLILRKGANYSTSETRPKVYAKLACGWMFAILLYGPAIIGYDRWRGNSIQQPGSCMVEFIYDAAYQFFTVAMEFGAASVTIVGLNMAVYWEIRKRTRVGISEVRVHEPDRQRDCRHRGSVKRDNSSLTKVDNSGLTKMFNSGLNKSRDRMDYEDSGRGTRVDKNLALISPCLITSPVSGEIISHQIHVLTVDAAVNSSPSKLGIDTVNSKNGRERSWFGCLVGKTEVCNQPSYSKSVRKDLKAAKALFIFVFTFIMLWGPFSVAALIMAFCEDCVHPYAYELFVWLLWSKSAVDPFLYAASNPRFKLNFVKIASKTCVCCSGKILSILTGPPREQSLA